MSTIKSIDTTDKKMRFLPLLGNITKLDRATKNKNASITISVPDEMIDLLLQQHMTGSCEADQFLLTYRLKD